MTHTFRNGQLDHGGDHNTFEVMTRCDNACRDLQNCCYCFHKFSRKIDIMQHNNVIIINNSSVYTTKTITITSGQIYNKY